ncbi:hypothetical protein [Streptomyces sp. 7N604]|uniref:hypothetical protein n=1 Tax=Streptomyces sp. 7N604 TaxID=3457415 RepID=UPI003FD3AFCD
MNKPPNTPQAAPEPEPVPPPVEPIAWREAFRQRGMALNVALSWITRRQWMHRRVDTFDFRDDLLVRCRSSIDLTIPESAPLVRAQDGATTLRGSDRQPIRVLPISLVVKKKTTVGFDLRDENDRPISRLRAEQSGQLGAVILTATAERILNRAEPLPGEDPFTAELASIARSDTYCAGAEAWSRLTRGFLDEDPAKAVLARDEAFRYLVQRLAENHLLCVLLSGSPGQERVLKVTTDYKCKMERSLKEMVGWVDFLAEIDAPHVSDPASYHYHVNVPDGITITGLNVRLDSPEQEHPYDIASQARDSQYAHLVATNCARGNYVNLVSMKVKRGGWLSAATASVLGLSLLFSLCWHLADRFVESSDSAPEVHTDVVLLFATLFLAAEATILTILAKQGEHLLTSQMLNCLRKVMYVVTLLPFAAVLFLGFARSANTLSTAFAVMFWFSLAFSVPLLIAYFQPGRRNDI